MLLNNQKKDSVHYLIPGYENKQINFEEIKTFIEDFQGEENYLPELKKKIQTEINIVDKYFNQKLIDQLHTFGENFKYQSEKYQKYQFSNMNFEEYIIKLTNVQNKVKSNLSGDKQLNKNIFNETIDQINILEDLLCQKQIGDNDSRLFPYSHKRIFLDNLKDFNFLEMQLQSNIIILAEINELIEIQEIDLDLDKMVNQFNIFKIKDQFQQLKETLLPRLISRLFQNNEINIFNKTFENQLSNPDDQQNKLSYQALGFISGFILFFIGAEIQIQYSKNQFNHKYYWSLQASIQIQIQMLSLFWLFNQVCNKMDKQGVDWRLVLGLSYKNNISKQDIRKLQIFSCFQIGIILALVLLFQTGVVTEMMMFQWAEIQFFLMMQILVSPFDWLYRKARIVALVTFFKQFLPPLIKPTPALMLFSDIFSSLINIFLLIIFLTIKQVNGWEDDESQAAKQYSFIMFLGVLPHYCIFMQKFTMLQYRYLTADVLNIILRVITVFMLLQYYQQEKRIFSAQAIFLTCYRIIQDIFFGMKLVVWKDDKCLENLEVNIKTFRTKKSLSNLSVSLNFSPENNHMEKDNFIRKKVDQMRDFKKSQMSQSLLQMPIEEEQKGILFQFNPMNMRFRRGKYPSYWQKWFVLANTLILINWVQTLQLDVSDPKETYFDIFPKRGLVDMTIIIFEIQRRSWWLVFKMELESQNKSLIKSLTNHQKIPYLLSII